MGEYSICLAQSSFRQLYCEEGDLQSGDILLKMKDGSLISKIISTGQKLTGQENSDFVHAGLLYDRNYIIESQGAGVVANDLRVGDLPYGYIVFRARDRNLAEGASEFAKLLFDAHAANESLRYGLGAAALSVIKRFRPAQDTTSLDARVDAIVNGADHKFFCSQFVTFVYQFTGEQNNIAPRDLINLDDTRVSPARLAQQLSGNTRYFEQVGYLLPGERQKPAETLISVSPERFSAKNLAMVRGLPASTSGVLILANAKQEAVIAKYVAEESVQATYPEHVFRMLNIPSTGTILVTGTDFKSLDTAIRRLAASGDAAVVVQRSAADAAGIQLQRLVKGLEGTQSVADALGCMHYSGAADQARSATQLLQNEADTNRRLRILHALLQAFSNPEQLRMLGRLSVADGFLGNEDRLSRDLPNLANLMLENFSGTSAFIAIDSFAGAASPETYAWSLAADELAVELSATLRPGAPATIKADKPPVAAILSRLKAGNRLTYSAWHDGLIQGYVSWQGTRGQQTASLEKILDIESEATRISDYLRSSVILPLLNSVDQVNPALMPETRPGTENVVEQTWRNNPDSRIWAAAAVSSISVSAKSGRAHFGRLRDYVFDWDQITNALQEGMAEAGRTLDQAGKDHTDFAKSTLGKAATGSQTFVSTEALRIRHAYLAAKSASGGTATSPGQIRPLSLKSVKVGNRTSDVNSKEIDTSSLTWKYSRSAVGADISVTR